MKQTAPEVTRKIQLPFMHEDARGVWDSVFYFQRVYYSWDGYHCCIFGGRSVHLDWTGWVKMAIGMANG
jgi:hypothetical protein